MAAEGRIVNFNNGEGVVRAIVMRELSGGKVYVAAPERGSGHFVLEKGQAADDGSYAGIPARAPRDYDEGGGGGLTYHELADEENA